MANRRTEDFFVTFGSDAKDFSQRLKADLAGAHTEIRALNTALAQLDRDVAKRSAGGGAGSGLFTNLAQTVTEISKLPGSFKTIATDLGKVIGELQSAVGNIKNIKVTVPRASLQVSEETVSAAQPRATRARRTTRPAASAAAEQKAADESATASEASAKAAGRTAAANKRAATAAEKTATAAQKAADEAEEAARKTQAAARRGPRKLAAPGGNIVDERSADELEGFLAKSAERYQALLKKIGSKHVLPTDLSSLNEKDYDKAVKAAVKAVLDFQKSAVEVLQETTDAAKRATAQTKSTPAPKAPAPPKPAPTPAPQPAPASRPAAQSPAPARQTESQAALDKARVDRAAGLNQEQIRSLPLPDKQELARALGLSDKGNNAQIAKRLNDAMVTVREELSKLASATVAETRATTESTRTEEIKAGANRTAARASEKLAITEEAAEKAVADLHEKSARAARQPPSTINAARGRATAAQKEVDRLQSALETGSLQDGPAIAAKIARQREIRDQNLDVVNQGRLDDVRAARGELQASLASQISARQSTSKGFGTKAIQPGLKLVGAEGISQILGARQFPITEGTNNPATAVKKVIERLRGTIVNAIEDDGQRAAASSALDALGRKGAIDALLRSTKSFSTPDVEDAKKTAAALAKDTLGQRPGAGLSHGIKDLEVVSKAVHDVLAHQTQEITEAEEFLRRVTSRRAGGNLPENLRHISDAAAASIVSPEPYTENPGQANSSGAARRRDFQSIIAEINQRGKPNAEGLTRSEGSLAIPIETAYQILQQELRSTAATHPRGLAAGVSGNPNVGGNILGALGSVISTPPGRARRADLVQLTPEEANDPQLQNRVARAVETLAENRRSIQSTALGGAAALLHSDSHFNPFLPSSFGLGRQKDETPDQRKARLTAARATGPIKDAIAALDHLILEAAAEVTKLNGDLAKLKPGEGQAVRDRIAGLRELISNTTGHDLDTAASGAQERQNAREVFDARRQIRETGSYGDAKLLKSAFDQAYFGRRQAPGATARDPLAGTSLVSSTGVVVPGRFVDKQEFQERFPTPTPAQSDQFEALKDIRLGPKSKRGFRRGGIQGALEAIGRASEELNRAIDSGGDNPDRAAQTRIATLRAAKAKADAAYQKQVDAYIKGYADLFGQSQPILSDAELKARRQEVAASRDTLLDPGFKPLNDRDEHLVALAQAAADKERLLEEHRTRQRVQAPGERSTIGTGGSTVAPQGPVTSFEQLLKRVPDAQKKFLANAQLIRQAGDQLAFLAAETDGTNAAIRKQIEALEKNRARVKPAGKRFEELTAQINELNQQLVKPVSKAVQGELAASIGVTASGLTPEEAGRLRNQVTDYKSQREALGNPEDSIHAKTAAQARDEIARLEAERQARATQSAYRPTPRTREAQAQLDQLNAALAEGGTIPRGQTRKNLHDQATALNAELQGVTRGRPSIAERNSQVAEVDARLNAAREKLVRAEEALAKDEQHRAAITREITSREEQLALPEHNLTPVGLEEARRRAEFAQRAAVVQAAETQRDIPLAPIRRSVLGETALKQTVEGLIHGAAEEAKQAAPAAKATVEEAVASVVHGAAEAAGAVGVNLPHTTGQSELYTAAAEASNKQREAAKALDEADKISRHLSGEKVLSERTVSTSRNRLQRYLGEPTGGLNDNALGELVDRARGAARTTIGSQNQDLVALGDSIHKQLTTGGGGGGPIDVRVVSFGAAAQGTLNSLRSGRRGGRVEEPESGTGANTGRRRSPSGKNLTDVEIERHDVRDESGQKIGERLYAFKGDKLASAIQFTVDEAARQVTVHGIETRKGFENQGLAGHLHDALRQLFPDHTFDHIAHTPEGAAFTEKYIKSRNLAPGTIIASDPSQNAHLAEHGVPRFFEEQPGRVSELEQQHNEERTAVSAQQAAQRAKQIDDERNLARQQERLAKFTNLPPTAQASIQGNNPLGALKALVAEGYRLGAAVTRVSEQLGLSKTEAIALREEFVRAGAAERAAARVTNVPRATRTPEEVDAARAQRRAERDANQAREASEVRAATLANLPASAQQAIAAGDQVGAVRALTAEGLKLYAAISRVREQFQLSKAEAAALREQVVQLNAAEALARKQPPAPRRDPNQIAAERQQRRDEANAVRTSERQAEKLAQFQQLPRAAQQAIQGGDAIGAIKALSAEGYKLSEAITRVRQQLGLSRAEVVALKEEIQRVNAAEAQSRKQQGKSPQQIAQEKADAEASRREARDASNRALRLERQSLSPEVQRLLDKGHAQEAANRLAATPGVTPGQAVGIVSRQLGIKGEAKNALGIGVAENRRTLDQTSRAETKLAEETKKASEALSTEEARLRRVALIMPQLSAATQEVVRELQRLLAVEAEMRSKGQQVPESLRAQIEEARIATHIGATSDLAQPKSVDQYGREVRSISGSTATKNVNDLLGTTGPESTRIGREAAARITNGMEGGFQSQQGTASRFFGPQGFFGRLFSTGASYIVRQFSAGIVFGIGNEIQRTFSEALSAQSEFVRISNGLSENGADKAGTTGLRSSLQNISTSLGQPLHEVYTTASNLVGVFNKPQDIAFATRAVEQLKLISNGALSATEGVQSLAAAQEAFPKQFDGGQGFQQLVDLSTQIQNVTGANVEDQLKGLATIGPQAKALKLSPTDALLLPGLIAKRTGQSGDAASEQLSRILASLQTGKGQRALRQAGVSDTTLKSRDYSSIIQELLGNVESGKATPGAIQNLVNVAGPRQARAFQAALDNPSKTLEAYAAAATSAGAGTRRIIGLMETLNREIQKVQQGFTGIVTKLIDIGAFDAFGFLLKGTIAVLDALNALLGVIDRFQDSNSFFHFITHGIGLLLGLAAVMKTITIGAGALRTRLSTAAEGDGIVGAIAQNRGRQQAGREAVNASRTAAQSVARVNLLPDELAPDPTVAQRFAATRTRVRNFLARSLTEEEVAMRQATAQAGGGALSGGRSGIAGALASGRAAASRGVFGANLVAGAAGQMVRFGETIFRVERGTSFASRGLSKFQASLLGIREAGTIAAASTKLISGALTAGLIALPFILGALSDRKQRAQDANDALDSVLPRQPKAKTETDEQINKLQTQIEEQRKGEGSFGNALLNTYLSKNIGRNVLGGVSSLLGADLKAITGYGGLQSYGDDLIANGDTKTKSQNADTAGTDIAKLGTKTSLGIVSAIKAGKSLKDIQDEYNTAARAIIDGAGKLDDSDKTALAQQVLKTQQAIARGVKKTLDAQLALKNLGTYTDDQLSGMLELSNQLFNLGPETRAKYGNTFYQQALDDGTLSDDPKDPARQALAQQAGVGTYSINTGALRKAALAGKELPTSLPPVYTSLLKLLQQPGTGAQEKKDIEEKLKELEGGVTPNEDLRTQFPDLVNYKAPDAKKSKSYLDQLKATKKNLEAQLPSLNVNVAAASIFGKDSDQYKTALKNRTDVINQINTVTAQIYTETVDNAKALAGLLAVTGGSTSAQADALQGVVDGLTAGLKNLEKGSAAYKQQQIAIAQAKRDYAEFNDRNVNAVTTGDGRTFTGTNAVSLDAATTYDPLQSARDAQSIADQQLATAQGSDGFTADDINQLKINAVQAAKQVAQLIEGQAQSEAALAIAIDNAAGDTVQAAKDAQAEADRQLAKAVKDKTGPTDINQKKAAAVTAAAATRDAILNDTLSDLDFQRQMGQISINTYIAGLQEILKQTNLTKAQRHDLELKIKGLQNDLKQQLTGSGFNIPADIKLPTAYQVRRSLGIDPVAGGTGGAQPTVVTTNNNPTINITAPTAAVAHQIAQQVVTIINTQNATGARASSSTPRLVS